MDFIELQPKAENLMESTRSIGYSFPAAIADLIDNSIAAGASNIKIFFPRLNHEYLTILDDGSGMTHDGLLNAMSYGSSELSKNREKQDLGRFGLGLKMASLSQCRELIVATKKNNIISIASWNLNEIQKQKKWYLLLLSEEMLADIPEFHELKSKEQGTLVIWKDLDLLLQDCNNDVESDQFKKQLKEVQDHLSLVFHRFLKYSPRIEESVGLSMEDVELIKIECDGVLLEGIDPFLSELSNLDFPPDSPIMDEPRVIITPWVLPYKISDQDIKKIGDLQQFQGFYIYRNRRLVIRGSWFHLNSKKELSKLIRVQVDIPNSSKIDRDWRLDVKKSSASLPQSLKIYLKRAVQSLSHKSKRTFTKRAKIECTGNSMWIRSVDEESNVTYSINEENSYVKALIDKYPELRNFLKIVSLTLPYDSIYADRADKTEIKKTNVDEEEFLKYLDSLPENYAKIFKESINV